MNKSDTAAVTGASGFTGRYITARLLARGHRVLSLTGHPSRPHPFGGQVQSAAYDFVRPERLVERLRGVSTLYNTYWVRFSRGAVTFETAVKNTRILLRAAKEAGVKRVVHVSITNPSEDSPLPYFRGKAMLERDVRESGISWAILRPAVIFGREDILINNIAWFLRHLPVFGLPGDGQYRLRPIFVEDMADLAVEYGMRSENATLDAVGPDLLTFEELARLIARCIGSKARIMRMPPWLALWSTRVVGAFTGDVVLTRDEMDGLLANLLHSKGPPTGKTRLEDWLRASREHVGAKYASEVARHYR
jgi:NADH dehydrogenase